LERGRGREGIGREVRVKAEAGETSSMHASSTSAFRSIFTKPANTKVDLAGILNRLVFLACCGVMMMRVGPSQTRECKRFSG